MGERRTVVIVGATIILVVGLLLLWAFAPGQHPRAAALTEVTDRRTLETQVEISRIGIETSENFVGHRIRVIHATVRNNSDKPLRMVDVRMVFTDYDAKPIQESVQRVFEVTRKPLAPGGQYRVEVNFENLPRTWNYHIPNIEVVKAGY